MLLQRNIRNFYRYKFFKSLNFWLPVFVIYLQSTAICYIALPIKLIGLRAYPF
jgi:hypothetical protein